MQHGHFQSRRSGSRRWLSYQLSLLLNHTLKSLFEIFYSASFGIKGGIDVGSSWIATRNHFSFYTADFCKGTALLPVVYLSQSQLSSAEFTEIAFTSKILSRILFHDFHPLYILISFSFFLFLHRRSMASILFQSKNEELKIMRSQLEIESSVFDGMSSNSVHMHHHYRAVIE